MLREGRGRDAGVHADHHVLDTPMEPRSGSANLPS